MRRFGTCLGRATSAITCLPLWLATFAADAATGTEVRFREEERARPVSREEVAAAMKLQRGFDVAATTNGSRFQAGVILELARRALANDPAGPPLRVGYREGFSAFLERAGLTAARSPVFVSEAYRHQQDQLIEYRQDCVVRRVLSGPAPRLAVSVKASWPEDPGRPGSFSYVDTLSQPHLRVTNQRVITYRLLRFEDMLVYDEVQGVSGRPITGLLGLLFRLIGDAQVVASRSAVAADGAQVTLARTRKGPFDLSTTVTIRPDGVAEKGVPSDRPDLQALARILARSTAIEYRSLDCK